MKLICDGYVKLLGPDSDYWENQEIELEEDSAGDSYGRDCIIFKFNIEGDMRRIAVPVLDLKQMLAGLEVS